ncbi:AAA-like domain-containing protein, partial [Candidatus Poribacteria bacterium]|nr:AAA-like domain-containing protein [Candidatus Poribacteria bacterium]
MENPSYDVFLSYNSEDRDAVKRIAVYLDDDAKLRPWLDLWSLIPGEPWVENLERGVATSSSCAVFVGKSGEGPWQRREVAAALNKQVQTRQFRVIPVLLPGAPQQPELPMFLAGNMWVDLRPGLDDNDALWRLECGIRGEPPGRGRPKPKDGQEPSPSTPGSPIPPPDLIIPGGAIDADSPFYMMRDADEEVLYAVHRARAMITVRGARQTGKTSLIMRVYTAVRRAESQMRSIFVDLQTFPHEDFQSLSTIWRAIAIQITDQLQLEGWNSTGWQVEGNYDRNFSRFLDGFVFDADERPLLTCLDEVDRVFNAPIRTEFFASIRAFYNRGAIDPSWKKVRWLLGTSSEPSFFIEDLTQSPFNIGLRTELNIFTPEVVAEFALRHGLTPDCNTLDQIMDYVGGR